MLFIFVFQICIEVYLHNSSIWDWILFNNFPSLHELILKHGNFSLIMQVVHMYTMMWLMCWGIFEYFLHVVICRDVSKKNLSTSSECVKEYSFEYYSKFSYLLTFIWSYPHSDIHRITILIIQMKFFYSK